MPHLARLVLASLVAAACFLSLSSAHAGGGPENLLLVVNANSWASVSVANEFIALRKVPPSNVVYLGWTGEESTTGDVFRERILTPVFKAMEARGILQQIDYIVYSSDFPYVINLSGDFSKELKFPQGFSPQLSLNSATFLWNLVANKKPQVLELNINQYMRSFANEMQKLNRVADPPTHGFRNWYGWGSAGELREGGGQLYMLSTMLAYTSGRGTSVAEAVRYLRASAGADGTFPRGTIYFTSTSDVRSTSRQDEVAAAIAELEKLGVASRIVTTTMPMQAADVQGLMSGAERFAWQTTGSTILPGAICDNFTSFGGILQYRGGQTPLTDFLRFGAAGAAGTVVEPLSLAQKFASPNIFVHYARGCSLAEAYYQAVFAPAQVLIVGDPLCMPWADIPQVSVPGFDASAPVAGTLTLAPEVKFAKGGELARLELFVDGRRAASASSGDPLTWDSTIDCDGYHELRIVAIAAGPIETQGRLILPVVVNNRQQKAVLATRPQQSVRWGETLQVAAQATGAKQIHVLQNGRLLGTIEGERGAIQVDPHSLGLGKTQLQAVAVTGATPRDRIIPPPVALDVQPAAPLPALKGSASDLLPGMMLRLANNRLVPVQETSDPSWLSANGVGPEQPFVFQGFFDVPDEEVYQFQIWHRGELELQVDGAPIYRSKDGKYEQRFAPVNLAAGMHRLTVSGRTGKELQLQILFGGPGVAPLDGQRFRHPKE
jgi:hypothetical protein